MTELQQANELMNFEEIQRLIKSGVEINEQDEYGQTALHIAIDIAFEDAIYRSDLSGKKEPIEFKFIELLLKSGADPNLADNNGKSPLDWVNDRRAPQVLAKIKTILEHEP